MRSEVEDGVRGSRTLRGVTSVSDRVLSELPAVIGLTPDRERTVEGAVGAWVRAAERDQEHVT